MAEERVEKGKAFDPSMRWSESQLKQNLPYKDPSDLDRLTNRRPNPTSKLPPGGPGLWCVIRDALRLGWYALGRAFHQLDRPWLSEFFQLSRNTGPHIRSRDSSSKC